MMITSNSRNSFYLTIITIITLVGLVQSETQLLNTQTSETIHTTRELLALTKVNYNVETIGKVVAYILKSFQIIGILILIFDLVSRMKGKVYRLISVYRFVAYMYVASIPPLIGSTVTNAYRGYNENYMLHLYLKMVNGWFDSGFLTVFSNPKVDGVEFGTNYCNTVFFESIVLIILGVIALTQMKKIKKTKDSTAHFLGSLFFIVFYCLMFRILFQAIMFFRLHHLIGLEKDKGRKTERGSFSHVFGFIWAVLMLAVCIGGIAFVGWIEYDHGQSYQRTARYLAEKKKEEDKRDAKKRSIAFQHNPEHDRQNQEDIELHMTDKRSFCQLEDIMVEFAFMHMTPRIATVSPFRQYYTTFWLLRWAACITSVAIWWDGGFRRVYTGLWAVSMLSFVAIFLARKGFKSWEWILILAEEFLLTLWYALQIIVFSDQARNWKLSSGWVWTWCIVILVCFFACIIIEMVLAYLCFTYKVIVDPIEENLKSDDIPLDIFSQDQLNNKIQTLNSMKSSRVQSENGSMSMSHISVSRGGVEKREKKNTAFNSNTIGSRSGNGSRINTRNGRPAPSVRTENSDNVRLVTPADRERRRDNASMNGNNVPVARPAPHVQNSTPTPTRFTGQPRLPAGY